jgi:ADP-ribose pyrophosphatase YjhB (NUDIX family)
MSSPAVPSRLRRLGFAAFYRLPARTRRRLVRLIVGKYIVGAVALVRDSESPASGRLLLVRQPPGTGWSLPAGLLRRGESPREGCVRELVEETGITLKPEDVRPASPSSVVHTRGRWVDVVFEASIPSSTTTLRPDGAEVLEVGWHRVDNLPPLTYSTATLLSHYGVGPYVDYPEVRR